MVINQLVYTLQCLFDSFNRYSSTDLDSSDSEAQDIDIDNMLDEGLPEDLRERKQMHQYEEKSKLVLEGLCMQATN